MWHACSVKSFMEIIAEFFTAEGAAVVFNVDHKVDNAKAQYGGRGKHMDGTRTGQRHICIPCTCTSKCPACYLLGSERVS